jgi:hypothetical protein
VVAVFASYWLNVALRQCNTMYDFGIDFQVHFSILYNSTRSHFNSNFTPWHPKTNNGNSIFSADLSQKSNFKRKSSPYWQNNQRG